MIPHRVFLLYIMTTVTMLSVKLIPVRKPPERIPGILIYVAYLRHTILWLRHTTFCILFGWNFIATKNITKILYAKKISLLIWKRNGTCVCRYACICTCVYYCLGNCIKVSMESLCICILRYFTCFLSISHYWISPIKKTNSCQFFFLKILKSFKCSVG